MSQALTGASAKGNGRSDGLGAASSDGQVPGGRILGGSAISDNVASGGAKIRSGVGGGGSRSSVGSNSIARGTISGSSASVGGRLDGAAIGQGKGARLSTGKR